MQDNPGREFLLFLASGGFAALANILSRCLFSMFMPYVAAICLAYCVGLGTAFFLFKKLVFRQTRTGRTFREVTFFIFINILALGQTLLISLILAKYILPDTVALFTKEDLAHFIGVLAPVFTSYVGHKYLTFKKAKQDQLPLQ